MMSINLFGTPMKLMFDVENFELGAYTLPDVIFTCLCTYISLWLLQFLLNIFMMCIGGDICGKGTNRDIIARLSVDAWAMFVCSWLGYESFVAFNGFAGLTEGTAYDRLYMYNPNVQRLLVFQMGYTFKTVGDAIVYNDGLISFCHHVATGIVIALAMNPFVHTYAVFFVGLSEVSTVMLCIVLMFQKDRGVGLLSVRYPTVDLIVGVLFSVLFIICRIVLWFYYSGHFWADLLEVLNNGSAHSAPAVMWYLFTNACLSMLQVFWLYQIFQGVMALFGGAKAKSI